LQNLPSPSSPAAEPVKPATSPISAPRKMRGRLILRREKKDRGGKVVVVISGFDAVPGSSAVMIADLAKELKGKLGCGGTFDRQEIVLQGDRCAAVATLLESIGFAVAGVRN
jgi:translation initiation factor 1